MLWGTIVFLVPASSLGVILLAPVVILLAFLSFAGPRTLGEVDLYALNRPPSYTFVDAQTR